VSKKEYIGKIIKIKDIKTATVILSFSLIDPKYKKKINKKKKIQVHNGYDFSLQIGNVVKIKSSRPYSSTKRFLLTNIIKK